MSFTAIGQENPGLTPDERDEIVERLATVHQFNIEKLLSWPDRLMEDAFWEGAADVVALQYTPAQAAYLRHCWADGHDADGQFAAEMAIIAGALYELRAKRNFDEFCYGHNAHPVHDGVLMLLDEQMERLKTLHQLDHPSMVAIEPEIANLRHFDKLTKAAPTSFEAGEWVLDNWLAPHLLRYARDRVLADRAAKNRKKPGDSGGSDSGPMELRP